MAQSTVVKTLRDAVLTLKDGTGTPLTLEVSYEPGDFNVAIPGPEVLVFLDRNRFGTTPSLRYGADRPCTGSFSFYFRDAIDSTNPLLEQFILTGFPTGWVSTLGSTAEVKTCTLQLVIEGSDHGDVDNTIVWNHVVIEASLADGDPTMCSMNFTAYDLYPTVT